MEVEENLNSVNHILFIVNAFQYPNVAPFQENPIKTVWSEFFQILLLLLLLVQQTRNLDCLQDQTDHAASPADQDPERNLGDLDNPRAPPRGHSMAT